MPNTHNWNSVIEQKEIEPRTFGELHMNECRPRIFHYRWCTQYTHSYIRAWEPHFFPALLNSCAIDSNVVFFLFIMNKTRRIKNEFWRHKCFMGILIGIILWNAEKHKWWISVAVAVLFSSLWTDMPHAWLNVFFSFLSWNKILLILILNFDWKNVKLATKSMVRKLLLLNSLKLSRHIFISAIQCTISQWARNPINVGTFSWTLNFSIFEIVNFSTFYCHQFYGHHRLNNSHFKKQNSVYCERKRPLWKEIRKIVCATPLHWPSLLNIQKKCHKIIWHIFFTVLCITKQSLLSFLSTDFLLSIAVIHFHHIRTHNGHFHLYCVYIRFLLCFFATPFIARIVHVRGFLGGKCSSFICFYCCLEMENEHCFNVFEAFIEQRAGQSKFSRSFNNNRKQYNNTEDRQTVERRKWKQSIREMLFTIAASSFMDSIHNLLRNPCERNQNNAHAKRVFPFVSSWVEHLRIAPPLQTITNDKNLWQMSIRST